MNNTKFRIHPSSIKDLWDLEEKHPHRGWIKNRLHLTKVEAQKLLMLAKKL